MLLERTTVNFLTRKGGLKLRKGMTQEQKRAAIRQAVENVVHKKTTSGEETASTYIDTDPATHIPEQMERIKEYQAATDNKILAFVKRWTGLKDPNYRKKVRMDVASVDQRTIDDIQGDKGQTRGWFLCLGKSGIRAEKTKEPSLCLFLGSGV